MVYLLENAIFADGGMRGTSGATKHVGRYWMAAFQDSKDRLHDLIGHLERRLADQEPRLPLPVIANLALLLELSQNL